ncbi:MAG: DUF3108 domain-containing protein [Planctomycetes bacterium]|nr:DUF3108 domain-containing protein [Planctomycetota bacterium]
MKFVLVAASFVASALLAAFAAAPQAKSPSWAKVDDGWLSDPVWYDGQAEKCVYEATRTIYGKERKYRAIAYTNKERIDETTTCKSSTDQGLETFKHHWSEIVPTENYDYRFSTCVHLETATLRPYKLTVSTQEDCGASFKLAVRKGANLEWTESVYFPDAGQRQGQIAGAHTAHFVDELPLLLRDFPFDPPGDRYVRVSPSQKDTRSVAWPTFDVHVTWEGKETIEVPAGRIETHHLSATSTKNDWKADYWFAADKTAPRLHVLVKYVGPNGESYALVSQERTAYWKR